MLDSIEYVLQRKATEHKKNGRLDLAIECLRKSNELMPHAEMSYSAKDYLRLIKFLEEDKQFEAADIEEARLKSQLPEVFDPSLARKIVFDQTVQRMQESGSDLLEISESAFTCADCSCLQGRVFSYSGADRRFPALRKV